MKNKKLLALLLSALLLCTALFGCAAPAAEPENTATVETPVASAAPPLYMAGTYTAAEKGMSGDVPVSVTFSENEITAVAVGENSETAGIGSLAVEQLPGAIVAAQSAEVDAVAGATITSKAICKAVENCIAQAKGESTEASGEIVFVPGTYTATVTGMRGPFDVNVTFGADKIEAIDAAENNETVMVGTEAIRILSERIVENQTLAVDALTGATVTSNAFLSGVEDCVEQAGCDAALLKVHAPALETYADKTHEADILVVGGGLAGVTAAISAAQNGGNVILLEQKEYLGGNSVLATGLFLLGGGTEIQKELGIEDDPDTFYAWIMEHSHNEKDPNQAKWIAYNAQNLIDFMADKGFEFNRTKLNVTDGSDVMRTHLVSPSSGKAFAKLVEYIDNNGIDVRYNTKAQSLLLDDTGAVVGVSATDAAGDPVEYRAKNVVLACGGFGNNSDMIARYWGEEYRSLVYGGAKGMDGTMLAAARDQVNAQLVTMDDLHIDATLEVTHSVTVTTTVLGSCGGILVRQSTGERFVDEAGNHSEDAADRMHELGDEYFYEIFDHNAFDVSETVAGRVQAYIDMGLTTQYDSIAEMAAGMGVDEAALTKTIETYNAVVRGEQEDPFGRESSRFFRELSAPFYVMKVANGVACTTGGLKVGANMQVENTAGEPVEHLYAIGEITGGYLVYYVGGDSLARSSISGMLLGERLAKEGE